MHQGEPRTFFSISPDDQSEGENLPGTVHNRHADTP
jgi:hypothetical protein